MTLTPRSSPLHVLVALALLASAAPAQEGLRREVLADGTRWETEALVRSGAEPGPVVVVIGGVHGNEPAGRRAAEWIRHWPVRRGRLILLPNANVPGSAKNLRHVPDDKPYDLNRQFPSEGNAPPARPLAAAIWGLLAREKPDWVIDLHESADYRFRATATHNHLGHSLICLPDPDTEAIAKRMAESANRATLPGKYAWVVLRRPIEGSIARLAGARLNARAIIAETCRKDYLAVRVRHHRLLVHRLLTELGVLQEEASPNLGFADERAKDGIRVAIYNAGGTGVKSAYQVERCLPASDGFVTRRVTAACIREGVLRQVNVVVFPGGTGSGTARTLGAAGRKAVRAFVEEGGGYLGICAGAYLATIHYGWSLCILDAKVLDTEHWARGTGSVKVELTRAGRSLLGGGGEATIYFGQGPILAPAGNAGIPDFGILAVYRTEIAEKGAPRGVMIGTAAAARAPFGQGRVLVFSPHPEKTPELGGWVRAATRWLAGK